MKKIVKNKIENLPTGDEKNFDHLWRERKKKREAKNEK